MQLHGRIKFTFILKYFKYDRLLLKSFFMFLRNGDRCLSGILLIELSVSTTKTGLFREHRMQIFSYSSSDNIESTFIAVSPLIFSNFFFLDFDGIVLLFWIYLEFDLDFELLFGSVFRFIDFIALFNDNLLSWFISSFSVFYFCIFCLSFLLLMSFLNSLISSASLLTLLFLLVIS